MQKLAASRMVVGPFDEGLIRETAGQLLRELDAPPTFALVFITPDYADRAAEVLELVRVYGHVTTVVGCSGLGLVGMGREMEEGSGFSLMLVSLPGGRVTAIPFDQDMVESVSGPEFWREKFARQAGAARGARLRPEAWLVFLNPYVLNLELWLKQWNQAFAPVPVFGSVASGIEGDQEAWVLCNEGVVSGGVALALEGDFAVKAVVSQGCKPIGEPLTVTQAERNVLLTLGSRPAYEVLSDVYKELSDSEREQARGHLFAGLAVSEYLDEYKRGDFLVRNIIGADPKSGAVAINALPRVGQTLQYQLRDSRMASDELRRLLREQAAILPEPPFAALLCTCHGRGQGLFGRAHHDAGLLNDYFPSLPTAGVFSKCQIGPVGDRSFAHGYTAAIALLAPLAK
jgi:small ligand-binding sensory domain FIST